MSRSRPSSKRGSSSIKSPPGPNKQNVDTIYLIQNQNDILKLKNIEMDQKITTLKNQLIHHNENVKMLETDIDNLRLNIKNSAITQDLILEGEKKTLQDKLALFRGNNEIVSRKIAEVREAVIYEESKVPNIQDDKINLERQLWRVKAQREGTVISLRNLEGEVQKLRKENQQLVSKRKYYEPKQRQISEEIQQRIRLIKNTKNTSSITRKNEVSKVMKFLLERIEQRKFKQSFLLIQRFGLNIKYIKKKVFMLSMIRKKYVNFLKVRGMQAFRQNFRPLKQLEKASRIIDFTRKRRIKSIMFRIWRSEAIKAQFYLIRKFEVQNQLQKLEKIITICNLFSAFNTLKKYKNNIFHEDACKKITIIVNKGIKRAYERFFSSLLYRFSQQQQNDQIEKNATEHTQMMIKSVYFSALAKLTRDTKVVNYSIKFRYFRELKKLLALSKRRVLGQMLTIANQKLKNIDIVSKSFTTMEFQTVNGLLRESTQENAQLKDRNSTTNENLTNFIQQKKQQYQELCLLKVSAYLKGRMQKAFNCWKNWNNVRTRLYRTLMMLHNKEKTDINFAFSRIQKRRFERLKISIRDKIASCEFSYNYLLQQNAHIKEILEKKTLDLEKSKFTTLLQRLLRQQKDIKYKYFFKFLRNGNKFWKFRKSYQRADIIISTKLKIVFMFLLKQIYKEQIYEERVDYQVQNKEDKINLQLVKKGFKGFKNELFKNKNLKRILQGIFERNLELDRYVSYQKIKKIHLKQQHKDADEKMSIVKDAKNQTQQKIYNTEQIIEKLTDRLKYKENSFRSLKVQTLKIFYIRNVRNYVGHYIHRWRDKVVHQRKITNFNEILQRKTRILIKYNFFRTLKRLKSEADVKELQGKAQRFKDEIENGGSNFQELILTQQARSQKMKLQNEQNAIQAEKLEKATDRMDQIKLASHAKSWKHTLLGFIMRNWKQRIKKTKQMIQKMAKTISLYVLRDAFGDCVEKVQQQKYLQRIRKNLNEISTNTYRENVGNFFRIWRILSWNKKVQLYYKEHEIIIKQNQRIYDLHDYRQGVHRDLSNFRIHDRKLRKIFDFMKKYTKMKLHNNRKKAQLEHWLTVGHYKTFLIKLRNFAISRKLGNNQIQKYEEGRDFRIKQRIYNKLQFAVWSKKTIKRLFIDKFATLIMYNINKQFLSKIKNYHRFNVVKEKDRRTYCIQKVIGTFEKKRKDILCKAIRTWNRNQYEINISQNLMRRLTRKSMYNRLQGCYYAWKRQSEAKQVVSYHTEVGEVKKRQVEIARLQKFLDDYKKEKGLLLENQEGDFVVSPRFQQQKSKQMKHDNILRYKFVSRLILSMNGYTPALKGWNNLDIYAKARDKVRQKARFVLNYMRRGDLFCAFKTWNKAAKQFKDMFQTMDRKNLIKFLCRHKDKIEMQYSRKIGIEDDIKEQLNKYKILSHRSQKRQVLCARLFARHARQTKSAAFLTWRDRVHQLKDLEAITLEERGEKKIADLEQQLRDMEQDERELRQSNRNLHQAVRQALQIAQLVKRIVQERDHLSREILQKELSCERLQQQNQQLNSKLYLAQKQALNLLMLSKNKP